jgi:hypothetical protein
MRETMTVVLRADGNSVGSIKAARRAVRSANAELTVTQPRSLQSVLDADVAAPRFRAGLVLVFALVAVAGNARAVSSLADGDLLALAGTYSNPHLGTVTLSVRGQKLLFQAKAFDSRFYYLTGTELPLEPGGRNRFTLRPRALRSPLTLEILVDAAGRPEFLHFSSRAFRKAPDNR